MSRVIETWKFRPHPLLANAHMQTVFGLRWPQRAAPYAAQVHHVTLEDGDQLALHEDAPFGDAEEAPSILLLHGLSGGYDSSYMCRLVERLTPRGYRVFRLDMRGCGAGEGIARKPNHCGRSEDVASALNYIAELYTDSPTTLIAFSMGGTLALNMLAEAGEMRVGNFERALMICPPIDLFSVERHFRTLLGRPYDKFFVKNIWAQVLRRWKEFPDTAPKTIPSRPKRLRDIDDMVIAPTGGFDSAEQYYTKTQPGPKLEAIRQPVTILFSKDDPVVPFAPLFDYPHSSSVETIVTSHGGHLGFLGQPGLDADIRWIDWRILEWLEDPSCSFADSKAIEQACSR
ncbi:YheT family hydrolase [Bythopirellula goksoeyrii]|uniref:Putative hydrolase n=1 Tax=Bythopirellula goksoeyrii TaxID=1400387 RepID=A0A5B9QFT1_9BACT|nr:alpha/beta fold hydrolase [Bythopirellula goksoeyrii]QEG33123.1 putative hydrolase [Bythopirellula goksoeyrii]